MLVTFYINLVKIKNVWLLKVRFIFFFPDGGSRRLASGANCVGHLLVKNNSGPFGSRRNWRSPDRICLLLIYTHRRVSLHFSCTNRNKFPLLLGAAPVQAAAKGINERPRSSAGAAMEVKCRRLEGKVAVVTASTQGIGLAIAERLGLEGAAAVISSRKQVAPSRAEAPSSRFVCPA